MGILAWLDRQFGEHPHQPRPAVHKPPPPRKPSGISEPVISMIESLGRDEWELTTPAFCGGINWDMITNVFHEHIRLSVINRRVYDAEQCAAYKHSLVQDSWMTKDESAAVVEALVPRIKWLKDLARMERHAAARAEFMILVPPTAEEKQ